MTDFDSERKNQPRANLDKLLKFEFGLTPELIQQNIDRFKDKQKIYQDSEGVSSKETQKRREKIQQAKQEGFTTNNRGFLKALLLEISTDHLELCLQILRNEDTTLLTDEVIEQYLTNYKNETKQTATEFKELYDSWIKFAETTGIENILQTWKEVFNFVVEIGKQGTTDENVYKKVKEKFPEFYTNMPLYFAFIRKICPWDHDMENLILQKRLINI